MKAKTYDDFGAAVVEPKGALVGGDVLDDLKQTAADLLGQGTRRLVVDMKGIDLVNSTGLGALIGLHSSYREQGGEVILCGLDKKIRNLFVLTRLSEVFPVEDTQAEALAVFRTKAQA